MKIKRFWLPTNGTLPLHVLKDVARVNCMWISINEDGCRRYFLRLSDKGRWTYVSTCPIDADKFFLRWV